MYYCFLEFPFVIVQHIDKVLMLIKEGNRLHGVSFIKDDGDCSFSTIDCIVNRSVVHRAGTLFFTNKYYYVFIMKDRSMVFISSPNEDYSIIIDYEAIGVHAICHSSDIYVHACVYCQVSDTNDDSSYFICHSPGSLCEGEDYLCQSDEGELPNSAHIEEVLFSPEDASLSNSCSWFFM